MSSITGLISLGGGGLTPKFQEFTSSGTFTPSQALIDAGGYIEVFLVGGGSGFASGQNAGGAGGEVILKQMYLNSTSGISVTIGAGASGQLIFGGSSIFQGSSAGGINITAKAGGDSSDNQRTGAQYQQLGAGWGGQANSAAAGSGSFGYGAGGTNSIRGGVWIGKPNSGQGGSATDLIGYSGYCLVKWYE